MDVILILLAAGPLIALALLGHIGFFLTIGARSRLRVVETQLAQAQKRLAEIDARLREPVAPVPDIVATLTETRDVAATAPARPEPSIVKNVEPATVEAVEPVVMEAAPTEAAKRPPPRPPKRSFEEALGARWAVWVGGVALALGALMLVRYSIEQGLFGPAARVVLGFVLAAALLILGENLRRGQGALIPGGEAARANAPAVLTGAGVVAAFGSVYAAHGLYHFIGPLLAFIALGGVSLAGLLFASLHGPSLAALGLLGSLAAPLLVASSAPSPWPVVLYLAFVGAANQTMARFRRWLWLALAAAAGGLGWTWLLFWNALGLSSAEFVHGALVCLVLHTGLAAFFLAILPHRDAPDDADGLDPYALGALALHAALALSILHGAPAVGGFDAAWIASAVLIVAIPAATGYWSIPAAGASALAGASTLGVLALWPSASPNLRLDWMDVLRLWFWPPPSDPRAFATFALLVSFVLAAAAGHRLLATARLARWPTALYAGASAVTPLGALLLVGVRLSQGESSMEMAAVAAALAAGYVGAANLFSRRLTTHPSAATVLGLGAYAAGAIGALASGLVFALDGGALTVALALAALGAAIVATRLEIPALRWSVAGLGVLVAARLAFEPRVVGAALSPTPIFNWLLVGYGVPALAFGYAARLMRRQAEDTPVRVADALAVLFAAFLVFFEIRHYANGGDPFARSSSLVELGLNAVSSLGFAFVLTRLDAARANPVFRWASLIAGVLAAGIAAFGLFVAHNPFLDDGEVEGGRIFNALLLAYLLPSALAAALWASAQAVRPRWYVSGAGWLSALLAAGYVFLEARVLTHGQRIDFSHDFTVIELGVDACAVLLACLALDLLGHTRRARALLVIANVIGVAGLAGLANPLWSGRSVGPNVAFNALLMGYLAPALLSSAAARRMKLGAARIAAILWLFAYVSLETRRVFQGPVLDIFRGFQPVELYAYTAVWLALGLALLFYGVRRGAREVRYASAFFVIAATLKAFLIDFSDLEGMYRAMSFIGLGAALIGIGLIYQKFVFARWPVSATD